MAMKLKRLHYGWVMVILSIFVQAVHIMMIYAFGVFLIPVTMEFNWERGALSAALSITMLVGGSLSIFTGRLCDKYGPRPLVTVGGLAAGTAYLLMAQISSLWQAYLIWGLLLGIAWSCLTIPVTSTIPRWFHKRRGIAQGLTMTGIGLGGVIWPPLAQWLISSYSWQQAYIIVGLATIIILIPLAQFMKHSPQRMGLKPYGEDEPADEQSPASVMGGISLQQVIKTGRFWIFGFITFAFLFCIQPIVVHITPHAVDIGISAMVAAIIPSIIAAVSLIGRVGIGSISDKVGPRPALTACVVLFTLAMVWLLFAKEAWMLYVFAVISGIAYGGETAVMTLVPAELFGLKYLGAIAAATMFFGTVGAAIGTPSGGAIFDVTGSYQLAFLIWLILGGLAIILCLILLRFESYRDMVVAE